MEAGDRQRGAGAGSCLPLLPALHISLFPAQQVFPVQIGRVCVIFQEMMRPRLGQPAPLQAGTSLHGATHLHGLSHSWIPRATALASGIANGQKQGQAGSSPSAPGWGHIGTPVTWKLLPTSVVPGQRGLHWDVASFCPALFPSHRLWSHQAPGCTLALLQHQFLKHSVAVLSPAMPVALGWGRRLRAAPGC